MPESSVLDEFFRLFERFVEVFRLVHRKYRREFFVRELFVEAYGSDFADKDLGVLGYFHARKRGDRVRFLPDDLRVERAVDDNGFSDFFGFFPT